MSIWLDHEEPRYLVRHYFWICLWGYFWMRLTFESTKLSQTDHHSQYPMGISTGIIQSNQGLNLKKKKKKKVEKRRTLSFSLPSEMGHWSSPAFGLGLPPSAHKLSSLCDWTRMYTISSPGFRPLEEDWTMSPASWVLTLQMEDDGTS